MMYTDHYIVCSSAKKKKRKKCCDPINIFGILVVFKPYIVY